MRRPVLSLLVAACALATAAAPPSSPAGGVGDCTPGAAFRPANTALAAEVVRLVNVHRAGLGLKQLEVSPTLTASATWKARHMATYNYMAHQDLAPPVSRSAGERIAACGYTSGGWGENIAAGWPSAAAVVAAWLQSPGHRANIENPAFVVTGSGAATAASGAFAWAQDFGMVNDSASASPVAKAAASPSAIVLQSLKVTRPTGRVIAKVRAVVSPSMTPLRTGSTGCTAAIAGHQLRVVSRRFSRGTATCTWQLAPAQRGRVSATILVKNATKTARATFVLVQR